MWILAQAAVSPEFGWVSAVAQLGSTGVALVMAYWFIKHIDKKDEDCKKHTVALVAAHSEAMAARDTEARNFLKELSEACHDVHRESTRAVSECTRTLGRALYVIESIPGNRRPGPQLGPSDSQILKDNAAFEQQGHK